jgi:thiol:disulfide interchange protein DsbA
MRPKFLFIRCLLLILWGGAILPPPGAAGEPNFPFPSYGTGPVEVRIFSDYFCPPCRAAEPEIEPLLVDLLKKNAIRLTLVDTPFHQHTGLYARYFLYALKANNNLEHALKVRAVLFAAALGEVTTPERIEALFKEKGIAFTPFDPRPAYDRYNALLKEDKINATPTGVIIRDGKREKWVGGPLIAKALRFLP